MTRLLLLMFLGCIVMTAYARLTKRRPGMYYWQIFYFPVTKSMKKIEKKETYWNNNLQEFKVPALNLVLSWIGMAFLCATRLSLRCECVWFGICLSFPRVTQLSLQCELVWVEQVHSFEISSYWDTDKGNYTTPARALIQYLRNTEFNKIPFELNTYHLIDWVVTPSNNSMCFFTGKRHSKDVHTGTPLLGIPN